MSDHDRFNRRKIRGGSYQYRTDLGSEPLGSVRHRGWLKCKLVHAPRGSIIVPDQIYLDTKPVGWLQPFAFMAPWLARTESDVQCQLPIDIAAGHPVRVEFHDSGNVRSPDDGSQLFTCEVVGPRGLPLLATGDAYFSDHMMPALDLFHHTTDDAKAKITASGWLRGSQWNIQGTNDKQLANVAYAYLTGLDRIRANVDLQQIAMASDAVIYLRRANASVPEPMPHPGGGASQDGELTPEGVPDRASCRYIPNAFGRPC